MPPAGDSPPVPGCPPEFEPAPAPIPPDAADVELPPDALGLVEPSDAGALPIAAVPPVPEPPLEPVDELELRLPLQPLISASITKQPHVINSSAVRRMSYVAFMRSPSASSAQSARAIGCPWVDDSSIDEGVFSCSRRFTKINRQRAELETEPGAVAHLPRCGASVTVVFGDLHARSLENQSPKPNHRGSGK